ncbi:CotH kinase family protein [Myxococcus sp. K15C18031901]|uniref:CotH kinase family protein n=1 Tax=Myxococcus dinghuensis TaxID=2906761 RepID=UPI0020A73CB8|nr:CotH kinase family protein [Myxococcus dinghuensis]MCP3097459.1 CotH kinase family protein [Myxococcus dinghuensis]
MVGRGMGRGLLAGLVCAWMACGGASSTTPVSVDDPGTPPETPGTGSPPPSSQGDEDAGTPDAGPAEPDGGAPDAGPVPIVCAPTAGETRWLLEGEALTATVRCSTGLTGAPLRFGVEVLPPGATFDEATATLRWTPARNQAAVWPLLLREHSTGETGRLTVGVVDNDALPGKVPIADPLTYTEEYGLPVFHLYYPNPPNLTSGSYRPAQLVYRGRRYAIEAKFRGATSGAFPKRSFTLKFEDEDLFSEPVFGDGFTARKRVALISTFNDNSYVRVRLAFDLWNRMSPDHIQIKTYSAVVFVNNRYHGLYTVADLPHKRLMADHGLDKDADLFKAVENDANFTRLRKNGEPKEYLREGFEKKVGNPEQGQPRAFVTLDEFVAFVADANTATFREGFPKRAHLNDYADWWIFNTLLLGTDSHSKNAYHAYDTTTKGPWRYIPWDLDATLGQTFDTTRTGATTRTTFAERNRIFQLLLADPTFAAPMRERYRKLLDDELKVETVLGLVDGYVKETAPSARRDWARWQLEYRAFGAPGTVGAGNFPMWYARQDFLSYEEELAYVRQWIRTRWPALESQLP